MSHFYIVHALSQTAERLYYPNSLKILGLEHTLLIRLEEKASLSTLYILCEETPKSLQESLWQFI